MKRKILFVIDSLNIGGAEKSLVSLLNLIDYSKYNVDLLMFSSEGDLVPYLPKQVRILPLPEYFNYVRNRYTFKKGDKVKFLITRLKTSTLLRINNFKKKPKHTEQVTFNSICNTISPIPESYDIAVAYSQGMPTYFVASKVKSKKKIAWINTDYEKTQYDKAIDFLFYNKIDSIVAVSKNTKDSIAKVNKEYLNKIQIILDIINPEIIESMAEEFKVKEFSDDHINILTVGRLVPVKSYDLAIKVALLLKKAKYNFKWYILGDGPEKEHLENLVSIYGLQNHILLLGKKLNPYPYIKKCDIYVQTSIKEGFGLSVCEAKILKKLIVCTNFSTANEIINHAIDGLIVEHDAEAVFKGIETYIENTALKQRVLNKLELAPAYNSLEQIKNFYRLVEI